MFSERPGFCLVLEGGSLLTLGGGAVTVNFRGQIWFLALLLQA